MSIYDERTEMNWRLYPDMGQLTRVIAGEEYYVKKLALFANGTRDAWIIKRNEELMLAVEEQITEEDEKMHQFDDDVLVIEYDRKLPDGYSVNYIEMNESLIPLVEMVIATIPSAFTGDLYEAYAGRDYYSLKLKRYLGIQ